VAKSLAAQHCHVVLADKNVQAMEALAREMSETHHLVVDCNVTDPAQVQRLIHKADEFASEQSEGEKVSTLLVNCAGITRDNWISKLTLADWDDVLDVNLKATFLTCQAFLDERRVGSKLMGMPNVSIVNVGSIVSEAGNMGQVNYAASKGGVLGLTRSLAKEVAEHGFRVNAVVPGFIETPMTGAIPDHVRERLVPRIPLKRFGQPGEVADLISFLLSPRSSYITGESIAVSGMASL
jgi:17beta-estradiol 17-dehydrogenase/3alpha(17beta)-hydroxysteroid dehydrogenase (NAD+)